MEDIQVNSAQLESGVKGSIRFMDDLGVLLAAWVGQS